LLLQIRSKSRSVVWEWQIRPGAIAGNGDADVSKAIRMIQASLLSTLAPWVRRDVEPLFREGERVTNEAGETVCFVAKDIHAGEPGPLASQFRGWTGTAPLPQRPAGPGFRLSDEGKPQLCIEGEWRPKPKRR
jgi:hypothetical protein